MDKLELKHLAPYLPYKLKVLHIDKFEGDEICEMVGCDNEIVYFEEKSDFYFDDYSQSNIKPAFRPLSDLSEAIKDGLKLTEYTEDKVANMDDWDKDMSDIPYKDAQLLFENHFDFLI